MKHDLLISRDPKKVIPRLHGPLRWLLLLSLVSPVAAAPLLVDKGQPNAENYIVQDGNPMAEIVVPENPCPSVQLAARELQGYIAKMTGATLPIVPPLTSTGEPPNAAVETARMPVRLYLGTSVHTDRLGVSDEGLDWGAYRLHSGEDWLVLLGKDTRFTPRGVWGRNRNHWMNEGQAAWDQATGSFWGNPIGAKLWDKHNAELDLWRYEQKGTLNAVYGFLRRLGVRWYMPGELGEVVPQRASIPLPRLRETVRPDYKIRMVAYGRYGLSRGNEGMRWSLRQGVNQPYGYHTHHGIANVTRRTEIRERHPEYFALYNDTREVRGKTANACLSNEGLFQENLRFVRFLFDMYDVPIVSVWPDDGFTKICQCALCQGKATPERGRHGYLSDYVWGYVNRMAGEIQKSHPGKYISGGAYSTYWLPPEKIDTLHSNVVVYVVNGRRRYDIPVEELADRRDAVREWARMSDNKVIIFMNHGGGNNTPRIFAEDIKAYSGLALGEDIWPPFQGGALAKPGFTHLNYYITARFQWDSAQKLDDVLQEYYTLFYGPAAREMEAFIDFYEVHQKELGPVDTAPVLKQALDLFARVEQKVDPASVYGQRVALFAEGLTRWKQRHAQISMGRQNVPSLRAVGPELLMEEIRIDGKLDEKFWNHRHGTLRETQTGRNVAYETRFRIGPYRGNLYIGIACRDKPGEPLNITTRNDDDPAIWEGDYVDILLETPAHSYYQISINPAGAVADLDRGAEGSNTFTWDAQADVATDVDLETGVWTIEARIPFTSSDQDPLHEVIGGAPVRTLPWFFNVCRQRKREDHTERSAFSPTGTEDFHQVLKFGRLNGK